MREEYRLRSPYISYLVRCRQGLLVVQAHMERLCHRVQRLFFHIIEHILLTLHMLCFN